MSDEQTPMVPPRPDYRTGDEEARLAMVGETKAVVAALRLLRDRGWVITYPDRGAH